jgi:beta-glucosidase
MDPSREGLLSPRERARRSSYDRDSDDDDSDLDATDFLNSYPLSPKGRSGEPKPAFLQARPGRFSCRRPRSRCCIVTLGVIGLVWVLLAAGGAFVYKKYQEEPLYGQSPPWYPTPKGGTAREWEDSYKKAAKMVGKMTLAEKVNVTTGVGWMMGLAVGSNAPAVNVGFPQLNLQDGPLGVRFSQNGTTAFPAGITVGATWNRKLMYERGKAHALEMKGKGINAILGPCVGPLGRMPAGGRNWEGFGADPYLQGIAGAETIKGIQDQGIMATVKHFVGNEQEHFRQPWEWGLPHAISSNIDDRTLHELYAWPFGDAVKAGVASVMCSYNMVNNSYGCSNSKLLNGILKDELGFQGFVVSDWLAQRAGVATALAGLDMTMPGDGLKWQDGKSLWGPELTRSVLNGSVPVERLNDMVTRIVAAWYQMGQDDPSRFNHTQPNFSSWTNETKGVFSPGSPSDQQEVVVNEFVDVQSNHSTIAHQVATEGIVLLKNDDCLPLDSFGRTQAQQRNILSGTTKVGIFGEDAGPGQGPNFCKDRGCNEGTLASGWGSGAVEFPYLVTPLDGIRGALNDTGVEIVAHLTNRAPVDALADLDICLVFGNADSGEGYLAYAGINGDRSDLLLQKGGDDLVFTVADSCKGDVVVVVHAVGPVVMERWIGHPKIKAVVWANLPGQESGLALADVLFGAVNPSGKLPYTIGKSLSDYGPGGQVLYLPNGVVPQQNFDEGIFVDYRHFDKHGIEPRFEFGFGLSYTEFELLNVSVNPLKPKTALPLPRGDPFVWPPTYPTDIPPEREALFPPGFRKLEKYIYPYLDSIDDIVSEPYPYPDGYDIRRPPSGAGQTEGGNMDLWDTYVEVRVDVKNVGDRAGQAVPQLYLAYPAGGMDTKGVEFPVRVLRGFDKVMLQPDETKTVTFKVTRRDVSYWDVIRQNWAMVLSGQYTFMVGFSSRDLRVMGEW